MKKILLLSISLFLSLLIFTKGNAEEINHAYSWGKGVLNLLDPSNGLGTGLTANSSTPSIVDNSGVLNGKNIVKVATGRDFTLVLCDDNTLYSWGRNDMGQLGNGNNTHSLLPVAVNMSGSLSGKTITQIACGADHSLVLDSDGKVYAWGYNYAGQLGSGNTNDSYNPLAVNSAGALSGKVIVSISAGNSHSAAVTSDGLVYTWGYNANGELGIGNNTNSSVPIAVSTTGVLSGKTITKVVCGGDFTVVLSSDGQVFTWGVNESGALGNNSTTGSNVPVAVDASGVLSGKVITKIACGMWHAIVMDNTGTLYGWGYNPVGNLGTGSTSDVVPYAHLVPINVNMSGALSGKTVTEIDCGENFSLALTSDGMVYSWGQNNKGQLGINSIDAAVANPTLVFSNGALSNKIVTKIASGHTSNHCVIAAYVAPPQHPTEQATNIRFSNITRTSMTVRWARGDGEGSVLLGRMQYRIPATPLTDGVAHTGNASYTAAPTVSGAKVLYFGDAANPAVTVTGLTRYQLVYFKVCEYNMPNPNQPLYLQTENASNPRSRWTLRRDGMMEEDLTIDVEYPYPNPVSSKITSQIDVFEAGNVQFLLYNIQGKLIKELYNKNLEFGTYEIECSLEDVVSGTYQLVITKENEAVVYPLAVVK